MTQYNNVTIDPTVTNGSQLAANINSFRAAALSLHSGVERPAYATGGTMWISTASKPWKLFVFDGAADVAIGEVDPDGFRHWVRSRLPRARVLEVGGEVAFVGYADVRRAEGWLVQGVYTVPHRRGQGFAAAGMSALVDEAFEEGADHVQLTVIDENEPALRLYKNLGFQPYTRVRTILFA